MQDLDGESTLDVEEEDEAVDAEIMPQETQEEEEEPQSDAEQSPDQQPDSSPQQPQVQLQTRALVKNEVSLAGMRFRWNSLQ